MPGLFNKVDLNEMNIHLWRTPLNYPEWVKVSKNGDVFLKERIVKRGNKQMKLRERLLTQKEWQGYRIVQFRIDGKNKSHKVHRLVMMAYSEVDGKGLDVNHKNGVRCDNRFENLEWCTRSYNLMHSYRFNGRVPYWYGKVGTNKGNLNDPRVSKKITGKNLKTGFLIEFPSASEAGRNGFSSCGIRHCLIGDQKSSGGYSWEYSNA